jgi:hypothetical protein
MFITFEHPNTGASIDLIPEAIFGVTRLVEHDCTAVIGIGNAMVPVKGTVEETKTKIANAIKQKQNKEGAKDNE